MWPVRGPENGQYGKTRALSNFRKTPPLTTEKGAVIEDKYSYRATIADIIENDYNLNIPRYVDTFEEEEEIDLLAVQAERVVLKAELAVLEEKMAGYLKELGYE